MQHELNEITNKVLAQQHIETFVSWGEQYEATVVKSRGNYVCSEHSDVIWWRWTAKYVELSYVALSRVNCIQIFSEPNETLPDIYFKYI